MRFFDRGRLFAVIRWSVPAENADAISPSIVFKSVVVGAIKPQIVRSFLAKGSG